MAPCVDFFGMISEQIGDGCSRLNGPSEMNPDMCAYVGDRITFKCTLVGKGEVTAPLITSPEGTVIITGLVIEAFVDIEQHTASGGYDCSFSIYKSQCFPWRRFENERTLPSKCDEFVGSES